MNELTIEQKNALFAKQRELEKLECLVEKLYQSRKSFSQDQYKQDPTVNYLKGYMSGIEHAIQILENVGS